MNRLMLLCPLLFLGCAKDGGGILRSPMTKATPDYSHTLFIGAGQSNMANEILSDTFQYSTNVAIGGTSISQWQKNGPNFGLYYRTLLAAIGNTDAVILWWQGENEGLGVADQVGADNWSREFLQMITDLRKDTGKKLEVIYVQIGITTLSAPYWGEIKAQQVAVEHQLPDLHMISLGNMAPLDGLGQIHYSHDQYHTIQKRMLQAYIDNYK